jgi:hypothetical protein
LSIDDAEQPTNRPIASQLEPGRRASNVRHLVVIELRERVAAMTLRTLRREDLEQ